MKVHLSIFCGYACTNTVPFCQQINGVSVESTLSEYVNSLLVGETGRLQLQVRRPVPGSIMSRYTSSASGISSGMMSRKESAVSAPLSTSSYGHRRKYFGNQLCIAKECGLSSSLHSLPEATLSAATEPQQSVRRTSVVKSGISMTVLQRNSEESMDNMSGSLTALHEDSLVAGQPRSLQSRIPKRSHTHPIPSRLSSPSAGQNLLPSSLDMSFHALSPHHSPTSDSLVSRQQQAVGSAQDINGKLGIRNSTSNVVRFLI